MEIKGKVAIVTGGASGIGRATAQRLAEEGAAVILIDRNARDGQAVADELNQSGRTVARFIHADVTSVEQMRDALQQVERDFKRLDILHNNAGIGVGVPAYPDCELGRWEAVLDIDLRAVILGCYLAAPLLAKDGGGVIINTASMAGLYPYVHDPIYAAAKAGVVNFTFSLAPWAKERSIRVNCICPGVVDTPLVQRGKEARRSAGLPDLTPKRMLKATDVAEAALWLIRDDSLYGRAVELRPDGRRVVDTPTPPGFRKP